MDENRREKSRKGIDNARKKQKEQQREAIRLIEDSSKYIEELADRTGKTTEEVTNVLLSGQVGLIEFDETIGKASLVFNTWIPAVSGEQMKISSKTINDFRDLRENFAPVAAGVEWHRDFTSGGGFVVQIDDINDKHKKEMKKTIIGFCKDVYQDEYTRGLDTISDIMIDTAETDGCSAAEIVYTIETKFEDYVKEIEEVTTPDGKKLKVIIPKVMTAEMWSKLGGIKRLKIIDDAVNRLVPYRHPIGGEVLYWTLDTAGKVEKPYLDSDPSKVAKTIVRFMPWEILWMSWNQRGVNLKGMSLIQPVYTVAKLVQEIETAVGKGFKRWANKKYFFVCGSERRPWSKTAQSEFLKAMEKMVKNNYVGIPVPYGFDIKEVGGEQAIFEGKSLLDHLIGMICAGMQYPREFLEVGKTQASDKSWLAWTVRYGRSQLQIRRAIEHQLWERHLWCIHGMSHKIKKKGVEVANQENEPTYVPKLIWRAQGEWHRDTKMKILKSVLDAANPADPPLKLAVEREMADVLGLGELDWGPFLDLYETQTNTRLSTAKVDAIVAKENLKRAQEAEKTDTLDEFELVVPKKPKAEEEEKETTQDELVKREEKRLEGGVSRSTKETGTKSKKGEARPMGGTRTPQGIRTAETIPDKIVMEMPDELVQSLMETEEVKRKRLKAEIDALEYQKEKEKLIKELREKIRKRKTISKRDENE